MDKHTDKEHIKRADSVEYKARKGALLAIMALVVVGLSLGAFFFWYVPSFGLKSVHPSLPYIAGAVVLFITVFLLAGIFAITFSLLKGKGGVNPKFRGLLIKFFLPLMIMAGGVLKIPRIKIEKAFIEINNDIVRRMIRKMAKSGKKLKANKILVLLPHCIQLDDCKLKVTRDVKNCAGCGKCEVGDLLELTEKYGLELFVLTGGTVARRRLEEYRPQAVVAVACERDLSSGIQDAYPLPVLAIVNDRPHGYCVETGVSIAAIKDALDDLMGQRDAMPATKGAA